MGEMYGHTWASQQGDEPNNTWIRGLSGITNDQLAIGLRACLMRPDTFPPTLPEFLAMCSGTADGFQYSGESRCHRIYEPERQLENKTAMEESRKAGEQFFANLDL